MMIHTLNCVGNTFFVLTLLTIRFLLAKMFRLKRCSKLRRLNNADALLGQLSLSCLYTHIGTVGSITQVIVDTKHVISIQYHGVSRHTRC